MPPNVLLVVLDSVRAQNTSLHGYGRETTPFLTEFSERSAVYTQARAPGMTSLPSHTSMFTGAAVAEHGAHDSMLHQISPGATIWDRLRDDHGYSTRVFSLNINLTSESSLRNSFEFADHGRQGLFKKGRTPRDYLSESEENEGRLGYAQFALGSEAPLRTLLNGAKYPLRQLVTSAKFEQMLDASADKYVESFLEWEAQQTGPWAACLNLMDAHHQYYPKPEFDKWGGNGLQREQADLNPHPWKVHGGDISWEDWMQLEDLYDGAIRQCDHYLKVLVNELQKRDVFEDTLLVITADHGEGFGEQSRVRPGLRTAGHVAGLHECLLHVPLLVSYPGEIKPARIEDIATLAQFPEAVQAALDGDMTGREFVPDGPVVASGSNIENKLKNTERARKYCDDTERFSGVVRAVYRQDGDTIRKYMIWGSDSVALELDGFDAQEIDGAAPDEEVEMVFGDLSDAGLLIEHEGMDEVSDSTKKQLKELGYV